MLGTLLSVVWDFWDLFIVSKRVLADIDEFTENYFGLRFDGWR